MKSFFFGDFCYFFLLLVLANTEIDLTATN